jgi:hypothetical protein
MGFNSAFEGLIRHILFRWIHAVFAAVKSVITNSRRSPIRDEKYLGIVCVQDETVKDKQLPSDGMIYC